MKSTIIAELAHFWHFWGPDPDCVFLRIKCISYIEKRSLRIPVEVQNYAILSNPCCNQTCYKEFQVKTFLSVSIAVWFKSIKKAFNNRS